MKVRPGVVLGLVVGLVVLLAVAAAVLAMTRPDPAPDPATPEGTVQLFLLAISGGDDAAAVALLDPALGCTAPLPETYVADRASFVVVSSRATGAGAEVIMEITEHGDRPFESWSHREAFELERRDPGWLITGDAWPLYGCK